jgi:cell division protein FtsZ
MVSMEKFSNVVNDRIMHLLTFIGKETVEIKLLYSFLDALSSNNDCDIQLDEYDIKWILSGSKRAEITVVQNQGEKAAFNAMQEMLSSLSDTERGFSGAIIHFRLNPEYPFMQLADAMDLLRNTSQNDNITFGTTTDDSLPLDFVRITTITVETSAKR